MTRASDDAPRAGARGCSTRGRRSTSRRRAGGAVGVVASGILAWLPSQAMAQYDAIGTPPLPGVQAGSAALPITPGVLVRGQPEEVRRSEFVPSIGLDGTFTSNANYDRVRNEKQADFVTQMTPGFRIAEYGAHTSLTGSAYLPILVYARTGGDNNRVIPDVSLTGTAETLDKHLMLEGGIEAHRQFVTPLGARPTSLATNTLNEYSTTTYRVTPSFQGALGSQWRYDVRDANAWTNLQGEPTALNNSYDNEASASLTRDPTPLGGSLQYYHSRVQFKDSASPPLTTEIARASLDWAPDPQLRLSASGGYENNSYSFATYSDAIYGVGVRWHPSDRTAADVAWEHRFFGSSWHIALDHRTPLTVWSFRSSRDVSTYPQQVATLASGGDVTSLLNSLFAARIPDPVARQQAIDNLIRQYGLPGNLSVPVQLYTEQARLVTDSRFVAGFLGARNNVYVTIYRDRNQQVVQTTEAAGLLLPFNDVLQNGANVVWSSRLSPIMTLTGIVDYLRSTGKSESVTGRTDNGSASLTVSTPISGLTDFHYGIRYQVTKSNEGINISGEEVAVFAGIVHRFR